MTKQLTKKQKKKADKVFKLIKELSEENVTFLMISTPVLELMFIRNLESDITFDDFHERLNFSDVKENLYCPDVETAFSLKLDSFGL